jgi:hypothetical protein
MNFYTNYVRLIFIVKVIFMYFMMISGYDHYRSKKDPKNATLQQSYNTNIYFKERFELLFKFLMSALLIYLFFPRRKVPMPLDYETRILLYLFGWVLILSANWPSIIEESAFEQHLSAIKKPVS